MLDGKAVGSFGVLILIPRKIAVRSTSHRFLHPVVPSPELLGEVPREGRKGAGRPNKDKQLDATAGTQLQQVYEDIGLATRTGQRIEQIRTYDNDKAEEWQCRSGANWRHGAGTENQNPTMVF